MKRTSAELKQIAREHLRGHYGLPMGAMVVCGLIVGIVMAPFSVILDIENSVSDMIVYQIANLFISLVSVILSAGLIRIHLRLARNDTPVFSDLFYCFTRRPDRFLLTAILSLLIGAVCMAPGTICLALSVLASSDVLLLLGILLLLGGTVLLVIVALQISLVITLLTDHDSMGVIEGFRTSFRLMSGNKGRLFYINLSFIGWSLLTVLSCGIGSLWLNPYISQTSVEFYRDVTGELDYQNPGTQTDDIYTQNVI